MKLAQELIELFASSGGAAYYGERVTTVDHMLQTAHFAELAGAPPPLVLAALLHDVGHLVVEAPEDFADWTHDERHEETGGAWLAQRFTPAVAEPVRLHVPAKRYLCATDAGYVSKLSAASVQTLRLQGGPMRREEVARFETEPYHRDAILLRRWDDQGKVAGMVIPGLEHYRRLIGASAKRAIGRRSLGSACSGNARGRSPPARARTLRAAHDRGAVRNSGSSGSPMPRTPESKPLRHLILILGDQLSPAMSSLAAGDPLLDLVLMCEVVAEATYVKHHKKKIILLFSAMRHFADELRALGWRVAYTRLDDPQNTGSFAGEIERAVRSHRPRGIVVTEPAEWRVRNDMHAWSDRIKLPVTILTDTRFLCSIEEFGTWAGGRKQLRMEYFYREMRRKTRLLMDGGQPAGGVWNLDHQNRKPAKAGLSVAEPARFRQDRTTRDVAALVKDRFAGHFGDAEPFWFAVTRADAEAAFDGFVAVSLARFGDYQDAMLQGQRFLYHSVISMYLNCGLLDPLAVCRKVDAAYRAGRIPLNAAEGYIRQVIGWREYIRGIYWLKMPEYAESNALEHARALPDFYWTGETTMACMAAAVTQTKEEAYAHHIQRLMVTGNFALLAGISPQALHEWYLSVYADAYEWVEMPNTLGMSQFADGGLLASKPYAASGAYINRMSDYCRNCRYDVKIRTGPMACPFNALYWNFIARHAPRLKSNPRMSQMIRTYEKFADDEKARITETAGVFLAALS